MTIFKIQVPLATNLPGGSYNAALLAYPRLGHPVVHLLPEDMDATLLARVRADCKASGKAYYACELLPDGGLKIGARVKDERW
jgi:hypothetical protein